jgi:hypothetical protein
LNFAVNGSETCCDGGCYVAVTSDGSWCHFFFLREKERVLLFLVVE